jgi:putative SOS response-associated peptidase YedK
VIDDFVEWKKLDEKGKEKQPYAVSMAAGPPTVLAGLWSSWRDPKSGEEVLSCTVMTCGPNAVMADLHNRMPVILGEANWPKWLGEEPASNEELLALLRPCPDEWLTVRKLGKAIGNVKNNSRELWDPID